MADHNNFSSGPHSPHFLVRATSKSLSFQYYFFKCLILPDKIVFLKNLATIEHKWNIQIFVNRKKWFNWIKVFNRVSISKTFAQFLWSETKIFSFFAHHFCAKKKTKICAIIHKSHFAQNFPIPLLRNSSFAQFRNFVKIKRLVTVCVS